MVKKITFRKVLIHTKEDGETHYVKAINNNRIEETLCGKRLHPISTVYTPKLQVICAQCRERIEAFSFDLEGEVVKPQNNPLYHYVGNKVYDKKCYNCVVEWLDDECSHEQERCDSCIIGGVCTKWEMDQWRLDNNQLTTSDVKQVYTDYK